MGVINAGDQDFSGAWTNARYRSDSLDPSVILADSFQLPDNGL